MRAGQDPMSQKVFAIEHKLEMKTHYFRNEGRELRCGLNSRCFDFWVAVNIIYLELMEFEASVD